MTVEAALLRILVCPIDKMELLYFADEQLLYNPRLRRGYRFAGSVPVLLAGRSEPLDEREHTRLVEAASRGEAVTTGPGRLPR